MEAKKKSRQFRKKTNVASPGDDQEGDQAQQTPNPQPQPSNGEKKDQPVKTDKPKPAAVKTSLLSFEEEEEGEEFQVKKSNRSKKVAKEQKEKKERPFQRELPPVESRATLVAQTSVGEYTPEKLNELRKNAFSFSSRKTTSAVTSQASASQPVVSVSITNDDDSAYPFVNEPAIPTAAQIQAAKERRTKMREGQGDGFIPLSSDAIESRLVREEVDDEVAEAFDDNEGKRISFGDPGREKDTRRAKMDIPQGETQQEDEDEELRRWEMEQIRKGGGTKEMEKASAQIRNMSIRGDKNMIDRPAVPMITSQGYGSANGDFGVSVGRRGPPVTLESIQKDLRNSLTSVQEVYSAHTKQLDRMQEEIKSSSDALAQMQKEMKQSTEQFAYFQHIKVYVADLLDCLGEKASEIESCEDRVMQIEKEWAASRARRVQQDIDDEMKDMQELCDQQHGFVRPSHAAGGKDEFGRDRTMMEKEQRAKRKEERAKRRKERAAVKKDQHYPEGWSSDEESQEITRNFAQQRESIINASRQVLADVDEQFCTITTIRKKFEKWKYDYRTSYKQAYISLSIPTLFSPFVRLQLLEWDPLSGKPLDSQEWYKDLYDYGIAEGAIMEDDDDMNLVPRLVEKVVLPRARWALTHCWDAFSHTLTQRAISLVKEMLVYVDAQSNEMASAITSVLATLQSAADRDVLPLYPVAKGQSQTSQETFAFSTRMLWRTVKLMRNIAAWHELLAAGPLQQLTMDTLLNNKILPFLKSVRDSPFVLDACEKILDSFPQDWLGGTTVPSGLLLFHDFVSRLPKRIDEERQVNSTKMIHRALRLLSRMNDYENAQSLAKKYGIKMSL
jgi:GC-rich sequence DNA-binding factor